MQALYEVYRPQTWDDVVGHQKLKVSIERMKARGGLGGRAFWLTGPSGCGKSTIGYLMAADVCDPENFIEIDSGWLTEARTWELHKQLQQRVIGTKNGRAVLVNEAHGLSKSAVRALLIVLEKIPNHAAFVFTTTNEGQQSLFDGIDAHPLMSRCIEYQLHSHRYTEKFAERCKEIAEIEGLGGAPLDDYIDLAKRCKNNFRQMLCCIEAGELLREEVGV